MVIPFDESRRQGMSPDVCEHLGIIFGKLLTILPRQADGVHSSGFPVPELICHPVGKNH